MYYIYIYSVFTTGRLFNSVFSADILTINNIL